MEELNELNYVFTCNEGFEYLCDKNKTTEIIGFVDEVYVPKEVGQKLQYKLFKFVLSNGAKKIACCVWGDQLIMQYQPEVLHSTGGLTKSVKSTFAKETDGFVPFEITIMASTTIAYLGLHNVADASLYAPTPVDFESIVEHQNHLIVISGYLKQTFRLVENRYNNMSYGSSAITNETIKVNLDVTNYIEMDLPLGVYITVTGEVTESGPLTTIICRDMACIVPDSTKSKIWAQQLSQVRKFPKRKSSS